MKRWDERTRWGGPLQPVLLFGPMLAIWIVWIFADFNILWTLLGAPVGMVLSEILVHCLLRFTPSD